MILFPQDYQDVTDPEEVSREENDIQHLKSTEKANQILLEEERTSFRMADLVLNVLGLGPTERTDYRKPPVRERYKKLSKYLHGGKTGESCYDAGEVVDLGGIRDEMEEFHEKLKEVKF